MLFGGEDQILEPAEDMGANGFALIGVDEGAGGEFGGRDGQGVGPEQGPALGEPLVGLQAQPNAIQKAAGRVLGYGAPRRLPVLAAIGGMAVPALIYLGVAGGEPGLARGWAIPAATDIAFAVGVLALLGPRVPTALRIFLLALAIMDDLGAIVIIAAFYTHHLAPEALAVAAVAGLGLAWLNIMGTRSLTPYMLLGLVLWVAVLKSGVHATLAGVVLAFAIPLRIKETSPGPGQPSPLHRLEHALHPWVAFLIVPVFALANAGVPLDGITPAILLEPIPLGIALGLFLSKQVGVMLATWLAVRTRMAALPEGATWVQFYGVSLLTGIGFTMSLFIGALAFPSHPELGDATKIGVLLGSVVFVIGVLIAIGPFAGDMVLFFVGVVLIFVLTAAALVVPWNRLTYGWLALLPAMDIVAITLMQIAAPSSALGLLWIFPTTWLAGGFGLLPPNGPERSEAASSLTAADRTSVAATGAAESDAPRKPRPSASSSHVGLADADGSSRIAAVTESTGLPAGSGQGRRVVFSESMQRVWLVDTADDVVRTYLVSGSVYDNLEPGTFEVFSRSRNAVGIDDSGTMEYFVRFTYGTGGSAIGFHTIPVDDGRPVQTLGQLGTPLSHGCIRQRRGDAIALWDFAPEGTTVVVTA